MKFSTELIQRIKTDLINHLDSLHYNHFFIASKYSYEGLLPRLVLEGYISRKQWGKEIGDDIGYAYLPLHETFIDKSLLEILPYEIAEKYSLIPVYKFGNRLTLAYHDPQNEEVLQWVQSKVSTSLSIVFSFKDEIDKAIPTYYGRSAAKHTRNYRAEDLKRLIQSNQSKSQESSDTPMDTITSPSDQATPDSVASQEGIELLLKQSQNL